MAIETDDCCKDKIEREEDREQKDHPRCDELGLDTIGDDKGRDETNRTAISLALILSVKTAMFQECHRPDQLT